MVLNGFIVAVVVPVLVTVLYNPGLIVAIAPVVLLVGGIVIHVLASIIIAVVIMLIVSHCYGFYWCGYYGCHDGY